MGDTRQEVSLLFDDRALAQAIQEPDHRQNQNATQEDAPDHEDHDGGSALNAGPLAGADQLFDAVFLLCEPDDPQDNRGHRKDLQANKERNGMK